MLCAVLLFLHAIIKTISSEGVDINECFVQVPGQPAGGGVPGQAQAANVQRPSPLALACRNNNEAFCAALFDLLDPQALQDNANP